MKITFILPCVGRKRGESYPRTWTMEPLSIAVLSALTPPDVSRVFYDDRLEPIPYDEPTDLVAISVETYTALRAYQIAGEFRKRHVPVVMGGFHPTLAPDDVARHADTVVIGEAEDLWGQLLDDFVAGRLQRRYEARQRPEPLGIFPDRSIYAGKCYLDLSLMETGRGCRRSCDFCSISAFFKRNYSARPIGDVVKEICQTGKRNIFFVDDNLTMEKERALALFKALEPLRIKWVGQVSVYISEDDEFLNVMRQSGCVGVLIGFESLCPDSMAVKGKMLNESPELLYRTVIDRFHRHAIAVYGTFIFGYDADTRESIGRTVEFASRHKLFLAAFNHLVPFPGTPLYRRLREEKRLVRDDWWLTPDYRFGDVVFQPASMKPSELADACFEARRSFYSLPGVLRRATNWRANCSSLFMTLAFLSSNFLSQKEVRRRQGLPLGIAEQD